MARTSIGSTVERIRRQLAASLRYEVNVLAAPLLASAVDNVVQLTYDVPPSLRSGAVLSMGHEDMRVMAVDVSAKTADVLRGWRDSDPAVHNAGEEVWVNPRFTSVDVYEAMVDELNSWGPDLFQVATETLVSNAGLGFHDLPAAIAQAWGLIEVRREWDTTATSAYGQPDSTVGAYPRIDHRLIQGPNGLRVRYLEPLFAGAVLVVAAIPFDLSTLNLDDDLVADAGLQPSMLDVLDFGVKWRLLGDAESGRSGRDAQDEPRRAEEVPPTAAIETAQRIYPLYVRRRAEEVSKLRARYPVTF